VPIILLCVLQGYSDITSTPFTNRAVKQRKQERTLYSTCTVSVGWWACDGDAKAITLRPSYARNAVFDSGGASGEERGGGGGAKIDYFLFFLRFFLLFFDLGMVRFGVTIWVFIIIIIIIILGIIIL